MSKSATGTIQDESGQGVSGVTIILDDLSVLFDQNLASAAAGATGGFNLSYDDDNFADPEHKTGRLLRLRIRIGRHVIKEIRQRDVFVDSLSLGTIKVTKAALGWLATTTLGTNAASADTGAPQRVTSGNAVEWLCDNVDAWGRVVDLMNDATSSKTNIDLMQLGIDIEPFKLGSPAHDQAPNIVLSFTPPLTDGDKIVDGDQRIERMILAASQANSIVRLQFSEPTPNWKLLAVSELAFVGLGALLFLGVFVLLLATAGLAAIVLGVFGGIVGGLLGAGTLGTKLPLFKGDVDRLASWFFDAGASKLQVRVRALQTNLESVTHAKIVINETSRAIVLGSPFVQSYFDSQAHELDNPMRGGDASKGPIHDMSVSVRGPAIGHLREMFNMHWNTADPSDPLELAPDKLAGVTPAVLGTTPGHEEHLCSVQVVRSINPDTLASQAAGETGVLEAYLRAIHFAEKFIYIENQYFTDDTIVDALIDALKAKAGLQLILLLNTVPDIPLYPGWQRPLLKRIAAVADKSRFGVFTSWSHAAPGKQHPKPRLRCNYLHTKSAIIDNRWATIGSANLDGASLDSFQISPVLNRNSEANCVFYAEDGDTSTATAIDVLRRRVWGEHLGISPPESTDLDLTATPVALWRQKAVSKRDTLNQTPNEVLPIHILEWPPDFLVSEPAKAHLGTAGVVPLPFEVLEDGPSYDFVNGKFK